MGKSLGQRIVNWYNSYEKRIYISSCKEITRDNLKCSKPPSGGRIIFSFHKKKEPTFKLILTDLCRPEEKQSHSLSKAKRSVSGIHSETSCL